MNKSRMAVGLMLAVAGTGTAFAIGSGVSVFGYCKNIPAGPTIAAQASVIQISEQITEMQTSIAEELSNVGRSLAAEEKATGQTIATEFGHQNQVLQNLAEEKGVAEAKTRAAIDDSPENQTQLACDGPGLGAGVQVGGETDRLLTQDYSAQAVAHDTSYVRGTDASQAVLSAPVAVFQTPPAFPLDGTLTPQQMSTAVAWSNAVTAPDPLPALPAGGGNTPAAMRYNAAARVDAARLSVPQQTLGMITALHAPTISTGTWADDTWSAMTGSSKTKPPGEINGTISDSALIRLQVNARYANPGWQIALAQKNSVGVLREIAEVEALRAHIDYLRLRLAERRTAMEAQRTAMEANEAARRQAGGVSAQEVAQ